MSGLLSDLKILDLVARHASDAFDATEWVGESSITDWFWKAEVVRQGSTPSRGARLRGGSRRGRAICCWDPCPSTIFLWRTYLPSSLSRLIAYASERLVTASRSLTMSGDWARLRILLGHRAELATFLRDRSASPLWHRAVRLLGVHLLETDGGVEEWRKTMAAFRGDDPGVHDLLLEAPVFAANAADVLEAILPDLVAESNGALLRRLLGRFLAFATIPDGQKLALAHLAKSMKALHERSTGFPIGLTGSTSCAFCVSPARSPRGCARRGGPRRGDVARLRANRWAAAPRSCGTRCARWSAGTWDAARVRRQRRRRRQAALLRLSRWRPPSSSPTRWYNLH